MSITLSDGVITLALHPDLLWSDEWSWNAVEQGVERSITGALIVSFTQREAGRSITLEPEDDSSAWMTRASLNVLRNWAEGAGRTLVLTLQGSPRQVVFRHHEGPAITATPVVHFADASDSDLFRVTLRLMEV